VLLDSTTIAKALDVAYDKAVEGIPGVPGVEAAEDLAKDYLNDEGSLADQVDTLIRYQVVKASASGFLTGLGGLLTLPVALPTNLISIMYIQLQTVAAIAHMGGYDVRSDKVKTVCYACLCGNAATDVLKAAGVTVGKKLTEKAIQRLSFEIIKKVNKAVGMRLVTKFGQTGVINLGKGIPLIGGVVGGAFDGTTTYGIGSVAKNIFIGADGTPQKEGAEEVGPMGFIRSLSADLFAEDDDSEEKPHRSSTPEHRT
jgi:hypothetical protein